MALRKAVESLMKARMQDTFSGRIRDISSEGHGVVDHPDGLVFFVRGTWPGDEGEFVIESRSKKYGTARMARWTTFSQARVPSPCVHFGWNLGQCGGCPWITVKYEDQLQQKQKRVEFLIQRNHLADADFKVEAIQPSPLIFGYRNRAQFKTDGVKIGYVSPESKQIAAIEDCLILSEKNRNTLQELKNQLPREDWKPAPAYFWNFIDINEDLSAAEVVLNRRAPFQQGNTKQNDFMKQWLNQQMSREDKSKPLIELFGGSGNFTEVLSELQFHTIYCAEVNPKAVEQLQQKKRPGVQGFAVDLYKPGQWKKIPAGVNQSEILILDPPREGFQALAKFIEPLRALKKIIYISCEPYRWAGDVKDLTEGRWRLSSVKPVDQFPHTPHVELLSVLERR